MKIIDLKCPRCGGNLSWEEGAESAHCPYCNANFAVEPERAKVFIQETVNNFGGPARPEQGREQSPILRGFRRPPSRRPHFFQGDRALPCGENYGGRAS